MGRAKRNPTKPEAIAQYRRARTEGGTFFFTVVTNNRKQLLTQTENTILLQEAFQDVMNRHPFVIDCIVLLPDHLHCIWTLPTGDCDFSTRWRLIKSNFSRKFLERNSMQLSESRRNKKERAVWQRRFWEHQIRDEADYRNHVEYIHFNPVKHGKVDAPCDWPFSSFHSFVRKGAYSVDWGRSALTFPVEVGRE